VTGELVPDPDARLPYYEYVGARQADWPKADFIIGNPPYLGQVRQRESLGDGYVDALRSAYESLPDAADLVMYWWSRAATEVARRRAIRAGLITTKSIAQGQNRVAIADARQAGALIVWAIPNHPWVDEAGGADVRVAMTVLARTTSGTARLIEVDHGGRVVTDRITTSLNADLSAGADVPRTADVPMLANAGLASTGFKLHGAGFILQPEEAARILTAGDYAAVIRPYRHARDLAQRPRGVFVIDFDGKSEAEARMYPLAYEIVRDRVRPERIANRDRSRKTYWWRFGRTNEQLRTALSGLSRFIATGETGRHRFFTFLDEAIAPDNMLVCIGDSSAITLAVLSSSIHVSWAIAAGGRLGVGNDSRYNKTRCFDPFPFPVVTSELGAQLSAIAEKLDDHRNAALDRDERVTIARS
jgi:hypothetical protein